MHIARLYDLQPFKFKGWIFWRFLLAKKADILLVKKEERHFFIKTERLWLASTTTLTWSLNHHKSLSCRIILNRNQYTSSTVVLGTTYYTCLKLFMTLKYKIILRLLISFRMWKMTSRCTLWHLLLWLDPCCIRNVLPIKTLYFNSIFLNDHLSPFTFKFIFSLQFKFTTNY